jgi:hypothetical protein
MQTVTAAISKFTGTTGFDSPHTRSPRPDERRLPDLLRRCSVFQHDGFDTFGERWV